LLSPSTVRADVVVRFAKINEIETEFATQVGTAAVKAARLSPSKIVLVDFRYEDVLDKPGRRDLKITMKWVGLTRKTYVSTVTVKIDVSDDKKWEALNVEYEDNAGGKPRQDHLQDLVKKLNR